MRYAVNAMTVDPQTGDVTGGPREEVIDTKTNELFAGAYGPWEVEDAYTSFWNRLNRSWEHDLRPEKVVVLSVTEVA